ncbi:hypothetical protein TcasGA2_TC003710 [Tribolium castaneum]|uniref:Uncharacterized protein n=1 Tax=Tribolium castaneum TaxID=7070 RepID=D6WDS9_TRICA|nr:hypothetical protein TcasGA2_TC003710 [Tribolium castaneum]
MTPDANFRLEGIELNDRLENIYFCRLAKLIVRRKYTENLDGVDYAAILSGVRNSPTARRHTRHCFYVCMIIIRKTPINFLLHGFNRSRLSQVLNYTHLVLWQILFTKLVKWRPIVNYRRNCLVETCLDRVECVPVALKKAERVRGGGVRTTYTSSRPVVDHDGPNAEPGFAIIMAAVIPKESTRDGDNFEREGPLYYLDKKTL